MHDDGPVPDPPQAEQAGAPAAASAGAPAPRKSRASAGCLVVAAILSVPILVVTFTKDPQPPRPVSISDMREHYGWHGATLLLFDNLEKRFPAEFAAAQIGTDEQHSGWVGFRAAVPAGAQAMLDAFRADPRNGSVEVFADLGFSAADIRSRVDAAQKALADLDEVGAATVRADKRTGVLDLELTRADGGSVDDQKFRDAVLRAVGGRLAQRVEPWKDGATATGEVQPVRFAGAPAPSASPT